jgi:hypothetical protein
MSSMTAWPRRRSFIPLSLRYSARLLSPSGPQVWRGGSGIPRQQVNYHVRKLEEQGLVKPGGERRVRNCIERLVQAVGRSYVISPATLGGLAADPARMEDETSAAYLLAVGSQMIQDVAGLHEGY